MFNLMILFVLRLASRDRARGAREQRRQESRAEKAANLQEKVTAYISKEEQTLEMFKKMAEEQRNAGRGLWRGRD